MGIQDPLPGMQALGTDPYALRQEERSLGIAEQHPQEPKANMIFELSDPLPNLGWNFSDCTGIRELKPKKLPRPSWNSTRGSPTQKKRKKKRR